MHSHGKTYQDISDLVHQSLWVVTSAVKNNYAKPDDTEADYDFVDGKTRREYPPMVSRCPYRKVYMAHNYCFFKVVSDSWQETTSRREQ
jgi:hypothetical protein